MTSGRFPVLAGPLFEDAAANFAKHSPAKVDTHLADRGPLLLTSGTEDHTVPLKVTKEVFGLYARTPSDTEFHEFEGRGHSLTIDNGWRDVAELTLEWIARQEPALIEPATCSPGPQPGVCSRSHPASRAAEYPDRRAVTGLADHVGGAAVGGDDGDDRRPRPCRPCVGSGWCRPARNG